MSRTHPLCFALIFVLFSACGETTLPPEEGSAAITIVGAKLIDGSGAAPIEDSVIVIRGTRIANLGPRADTPVPKGGEIIDAAGKVVIPGLIDLHCHYFGDRAEIERAFRTQLHFGVTTARSIGVDPEENLAIIADAEAGRIPAPRLYTAGLGFTHPEGHPVAQPIVNRPKTPEEAREMVRKLAAQRVDFIKMWVDSKNGTLPKITPEIRTAIVQEADKQGIPAVAHIFDEADVRQLAGLGVVDFLHTVRDREQVDESFIKLCQNKGLSFAPTLSIAEALWYVAENPGVLEDFEFRNALAPATREQLLKPETRQEMLANPQLEQLKVEYKRAERFVKMMQDAGVTIVAGSDSGAGNVATGWGTHHEMDLLVGAGLTPLEALVAATGNAARVVERGEAAFGVLAADKVADMLVLSANPLADIKNTRQIERVMQAGKWVERE